MSLELVGRQTFNDILPLKDSLFGNPSKSGFNLESLRPMDSKASYICKFWFPLFFRSHIGSQGVEHFFQAHL